MINFNFIDATGTTISMKEVALELLKDPEIQQAVANFIFNMPIQDTGFLETCCAPVGGVKEAAANINMAEVLQGIEDEIKTDAATKVKR